MKNILMLLLVITLWSCKDDDPIQLSTLQPEDLESCFSPEFGSEGEEQFHYNLIQGELDVDITNWITTQNNGYSILDGSKTVIVYRHFLENDYFIIDDEVEIRLLFQIDENQNTFSISSTEDFEKSMCVYAECGIALQSITGSITGNKTSDGNWAVVADLEVDRFNAVEDVEIDAVFSY